MSEPLPPAPYWMEKARRDLRSAQLLLEDGDVDGAANRTYYAMFHAATAAFVQHKRILKTHDGLVGEFGREFVATGRFPRELGRALNIALEVRCAADYVQTPPQEERVRGLLKDAEVFIATVAERLLPAPNA